MHRFWETIIQPLLETLHPQRIVEIGVDQGFNTKKLLTFCGQHDVQLEAIDPLPRFDVEAWQEQYKGRLRVHRMLSLNAIPRLEKFEAVLIDGDHNWYTVFHELKLIESRSAELTQPFPLVFLHDIDWPYGRRDLYYNPETIPDVYRKPYKKKGMRPETPELLEDGGINPSFNNAIYENNLQNGVLTAVEDFLQETKEQLELIKIPGFHGFGILIPGSLVERNSQFSQCVTQLRIPQPLSRHVERVEEARIAVELQRQERETAIRELQATVKRTEITLQQRLTEAEKARVALDQSKTAEAKALQQQMTEAEQKRVALDQRKTAEVNALQQRLTEAEKARMAVEHSRTTEVNALKQRLTEADKVRVALEHSKTAEVNALQQRLRTEIDTIGQQLIKETQIRTDSERRLSVLEESLKRLVRDAEILSRLWQNLNTGFTNVLNSRRWKLGHRLGAMWRTLRFKPSLPMPHDFQLQMTKDFQNWEKQTESTRQFIAMQGISESTKERKKSNPAGH